MAPHKNTTKDMTVGRPLPLLMQFAVPLIFGNLFQQLYNMVDTMIVGRYLGVDALAAVGSVDSLQHLIIGFCLSSCAGMAIPISQAFGAKDEKLLRRYVANSAWLSAIMAVVMTVCTVLTLRQVLLLMQTPANIIDEAYAYFGVILLGIPATVLYNLCAAILRALGDSKRPLYFLLISSVLNVILDLVFIMGLQWGCAGAAWATVIAQLVSGLCCLGYMKKRLTIVHVRRGEWKPDFVIMGKLAAMGFPMGIQASITSIGAVILSSAVNTLGSMAVAAIATGQKVTRIINCAYDAMGTALATYCGQNLGARKLGRVGKGLWVANISMVAYSILAFVVVYFLGTTIALLYVSPDETELLGYVHTYLTCNGLCFWLMVLVINVRYTIQGLGYSRYAVFAGMCEMVARTVVAFTLVPKFGFTGACFANGLAWMAADLFLFPCYTFVMKKVRGKVVEAPEEAD